MILHTVVPLEAVFHSETKGPHTPSKFIEHQGITMEAQPTGDGHLRLLRLISTNPQDYLRFAPGQVIL